ncbi:LysR substrate-binding domain-containing protein [Paraburkholderia pallida]|uniref:LysR family transcriptional regulator n=1 Tax=Paraburkholderia pallida TaxID=2547399 RepID=A0A4P7D1Y4_9BURK|nr:LysR substrate-binding domain-containing protein [Paraburkholderia pallida]QBR02649.1 LysR family transcriptional regulator [Paraburkholderia pallida]
MLDLNDFYYFVHVVDREGISAAARALSVPKSTVSFRIQQLEAALGTRLINRTTRQFNVTEAGRKFYGHAVLMLKQAQAAEAAVRDGQLEPSGTIRFTIAAATAQFATDKLLPIFLARYPKVSLVQHVTDAPVDLVAENFDLAIRAHSNMLPDSSLIGRELASAPWRLFAGNPYLATHGMPSSPSQLSEHHALFMARKGVRVEWRLRDVHGAEQVMPLRPRLVSEDMLVLKSAAEQGLGIVALPAYICREEVARGTLAPVLPDWSAGDSTLTALLPFRHGILPSVRAFMDFLLDEMPKAVVF